jgi:hypothetical protein
MRLVAQSKQVDSSPLSVAAQDLARVAEVSATFISILLFFLLFLFV